MKHSARFAAIAVLVIAVCTPVFAQVDELEWGGDLSVMGVYANNTRDWDSDGGGGDLSPRSVLGARFNGPAWAGDDDQDSYVRTEGHLWMRAILAENVRAQIAAEFDRSFDNTDAFVDINDDSAFGRPVDDDLDIYLEEAYIQISSLFDWPWTVTAGRQQILWGSGFVVGDSLPQSPTNLADLGQHEQDPFDAIDIEWEFSEDLLLELLFSKVLETRYVEEDATLLGANLRYSVPESAIVEGYYLFAKMDGDGSPGGNDARLDLHQLGVRGDLRLGEEFELNAECTYQFAGEIENTPLLGDDLDLGAFAAELGIKWAPSALEENGVAFGLSAAWLEGDDEDQDNDYNRYIQVADTRVYGEIADFYSGLVSNDMVDAYYPGVFIFNFDAEATFDALLLALEAYYFLAQDDVTDRAGNNSGEDSIGWEVDIYGNYRLTENLDAQMAAGFFDPDDAAAEWAGGEDDEATFVRGGLKLTF